MKIPVLFFALASSVAVARPLGVVPRVRNDDVLVSLEARFDLYLAQKRAKASSLKILGVELDIPVMRKGRWDVALDLDHEVLEVGHAGLTYAPRDDLVGSNLRTAVGGFHADYEGEDRARLSVSLAAASASDEAVGVGRSRDYPWQVTYLFPSASDHQWILAIDDSRNRGYLNESAVPMAGILYQPGPTWSLAAGFPFLHLQWGVPPDWSGTLTVLPTGAHARVSRWVAAETAVFVRGGLSARSYMHSARDDEMMRLFFEEKYVEMGAHRQITPRSRIGLSAGMSYDRSLYEGRQVFLPSADRSTLPRDFFGTTFWEFRL